MTYYDEIAKSYDELYRAEQIQKLSVIKSNLNNYFKIKNTDKLLDIGCGNGIGQGFFSINFGCETFGVDTSQKLLDKNAFPCLLASAESLPLPNKSFEIVLSLTAIQNFTDIDKALDEMKRVCKKYLIITFIKNSKKANLIEQKIFQRFNLLGKIEEQKDLIYFLNKL